jgi:vancomycin resistance protein VanW
VRLRRLARAALPQTLRRTVAQGRRTVRDLLARERFAVAADLSETAGLIEQISLTQPIRPGRRLDGKLQNLRLAAAHIEPVALRDGTLFSFWRAVGAPTRVRGFAAGRAIVGDALAETVGGGLCQLSGALYELALRGGLDIVERRAHSQDLYEEAERFTPLGLDATVVFGFTDLRFRNRTGRALAFRFQIDDDRVIAALLASAPLELCELRLDRRDRPDGVRDVTLERRRPDGNLRDRTQQSYAWRPG